MASSLTISCRETCPFNGRLRFLSAGAELGNFGLGRFMHEQRRDENIDSGHIQNKHLNDTIMYAIS